MANPPPPYENITGISRTVMKDNAQESIANYNGNARPGEIVVNLLNNDVYIGNTNGNLNLLVIGGGSGNSEPAGPVGAIQYNSGGNLFGGTANVTVSGAGISVVGNVTAGNIVANTIVSNGTGNVYVTGNLLPSAGTLNLGLPTVPWQDAYFGPQSITILDSTGNIGNAVVIENITANITIGTTGFTINRFGTTDAVFRIEALTGQIFSNAETIIANVTNSANSASGSLQTAGGAGIAKNLYVGNNIVATGNITGSNLTISGISNLSSNANVKITGGTVGQALTTDGTGNLSWTTQGSGNVATARGQFWSNVTQTVASANTEYRFSFNNYDANSNVVLGSGASNSRIIINQTGIYNIQFSAQIDKGISGGSSASAYIWFKKNGTALPHTAGFFTLDNTIQAVQSWNILANVTTAGDYYELAYAASSTTFSFPTLAGNVAIGYPASPSIIVTVTPVSS